MTKTIKDHQKLEIKPRHMDFPFGSLKSVKFFDDNIYKSAFMVGMSAGFPVGEGEFLASVRNYRDLITTPDLKKQVKGFIGQEGHHSHQHAIVNEELDRLGYKTKKIDLSFKKTNEKYVAPRSDKFRLAHTVCYEHLTGILGELALDDPKQLEGMEAPFKDLMLWHCVEEVEHKSVAYDVYMETVGDLKYLHRVMILTITVLNFRLTKYMFRMAFATKHWASLKDLFGFTSWMFGKGGMWRSLRKPFMAFFKEGFHPWADGGLEFIEKWEKEFARPEQNKANKEYLQANPA